MAHDPAMKPDSTAMRTLLFAVLCLLFSATAAAAQAGSTIGRADCVEQTFGTAEIEYWLQTVSDTESSPSADQTPSDEGCLACHGNAGQGVGKSWGLSGHLLV